MKYYVYILESLKDKKHYTGSTSNIARRISQHENGLVKSTCNRRPLKLIYIEAFPTKINAQTREKYFKSGKGREELKKLVNQAPWPSG